MPEHDIHTKDKNMAKADVKYKQVWKCSQCGATRQFPKDAWDSFSKQQQQAFKDELNRQHLVHPAS